MDTGSSSKYYLGIVAVLGTLLLSSMTSAAETIVLKEGQRDHRPLASQQDVLCTPVDQAPAAGQLLSKPEQWPWQAASDNTLNLGRSEEHTSELQSRPHLVCRLLLEKKNARIYTTTLDLDNTL